MSREQALEDLKHIPYHSQLELDEDKEYFLKKMKWSLEDLQEYLGINIDCYKVSNRRQVLRNCVLPEIGKHILDFLEEVA